MPYNTLKELYLNSISEYASNPAYSMYGGDALTYSEFADHVAAVADMLRSAGIGKGDKVALLSSNTPNWSVCYFAAVINGIVIVPILPDFSPEELDKILTHCEAKGLFVSDKLYGKISQERLDKLNIVIRTRNLTIIKQNVEGKGITATPERDDIAAIIYTSGTTSKPKGVMLTHWNLASQIDMESDLFPVRSDDVFMSILPLSHTYECSVGMLLPFMSGASVVYLEKPPTPSTLIPAMQDVRPTIMLIVPLIIEKIYKSKIAARFKRSKVMQTLYSWPPFRKAIHYLAGAKIKKLFGGRLRFCGIGGAKLDANTEQFLMEAKFPYAIGYGLTETAPLIAGAIPGKVRFRSTGPVLKGVKARLEHVNPASGEGEIVVWSPSTMVGYYKDPAATQSVFTPDGWFRTKDLGMFDSEGNLYIKGRLDNMIVGATGENIYPEEIESVLNSHSLVNDSIVKEEKGRLVALVNFNREEIERKYYDLKEELQVAMANVKKDLLNYVNSKVSKSSRISDIEEQSDGFEKTPTQKIKRFLYSKKKHH
jgi:long-chain acyl-CoA synthetase